MTYEMLFCEPADSSVVWELQILILESKSALEWFPSALPGGLGLSKSFLGHRVLQSWTLQRKSRSVAGCLGMEVR